MLLAASNVHYQNNLILGVDDGAPVFSVESNTNYTSSDYNGFRANPGSAVAFAWSTPPFGVMASFPGEPGALATRAQAQYEATLRETRNWTSLAQYSQGSGQDRHSINVDYDDFVAARPPSGDPRQLYAPEDFDFRLQPRSRAIDAGVVIAGVNDGFTGSAPDLGAYERGEPVPHYGPRPQPQR